MKRIVTIFSALVISSMVSGFASAAQSTPESSVPASPMASPSAATYQEGSYIYIDESSDILSIRIDEIPAGSGDEVLASMDSLIEEPLTGFEFENELDAQEGCRLFEFDANGIPIFTIACVNDEVSMVAVGTNEDVVRMVEVSFLAGEPELAPEDYEELDN